MLEMYEKRRVLRIMQGKVVEVKQSPLDVISNPTGVSAASIQECSVIAIRTIFNKVNEIDELLRKILGKADAMVDEAHDGAGN